MTHPHRIPNAPESDLAGQNLARLLSLTPEQLDEIGALFVATAQRLATDEKYRQAIQKILF